MNGVTKALTLVLGAIAVLACLATVGIIGYSAVNGGEDTAINGAPNMRNSENDIEAVYAVPTSTPEIDIEATAVPTSVSTEHVHDYKETVIKNATCTEAGQIMYSCSCGDTYYVDILSLGHLPDDEWEITQEATATTSGIRVKRCVRCGEILASETIPMTGSATGSTASAAATPHNHLYVATIEREPTCTLSGLRKLTCSCGDFYTETIPALGHVASDWEEAEAPTTTHLGTSQRVCTVCGALLDTKVIPKLTSTASASASASSSAARSTASAGGTSAPTATPHVHNYTSYVLVRPTCTEKGVRSYICAGCGSSYAESIELDLNNHKFNATFVAPTETQQGYTIYTCERCNYSYMDNYVLPLNPGAAAAISQAVASSAPAAGTSQ